MYKEIFSLRLNADLIAQFKAQSKSEALKQGDLFEKMFNLYLGKPVQGESVPFNVNLFCYNNIDPNRKNLEKKIYTGYGIPKYISPVFEFFGISYYDDGQRKNNNLIFENDSQNFYTRTELSLYPSKYAGYAGCKWYSFDTENKISQFKKDLKVDNPQDYRYMSAFRVFLEMKGNVPLLMVNEQFYLINAEKYIDFMGSELLNSMNKNSTDKEIFLSSDFDLAISVMYPIENFAEGEKQLKLDRAYLDFIDRENLKNILSPTLSSNDANFKEVLSEYAIFE